MAFLLRGLSDIGDFTGAPSHKINPFLLKPLVKFFIARTSTTHVDI